MLSLNLSAAFANHDMLFASYHRPRRTSASIYQCFEPSPDPPLTPQWAGAEHTGHLGLGSFFASANHQIQAMRSACIGTRTSR